jgi:glycosyltransferase involved in cell wall biosynthesis
MSVRLMIITAQFPYGITEVFFLPEFMELQTKCEKLLIVPRSPQKKIIHDISRSILDLCIEAPLLNAEICWTAFLVSLRHPFQVLKALFFLFRGRGLRNWLKNAVVFPKALWLAQVASRENITHIHAHWGTTTSTMAMIASLVTGVPWSMTLHRGDILENNLLLTKCRNASFVRFISEDGRKLAEVLVKARIPQRTCIIHLGIRVPESINESAALKAKPVILCPAQLHERKGQDYLLESIFLLKQRGTCIQLWLAGTGESKQKYEEQAHRLGISDSVEFLGAVAHEKILSMYQKREVDIVALPSLHEGIPVALIEAMAYGIPVVGTNVGGTPELLGEGAGLIIPPRDPLALADTLEYLISSEEKRSSLAHRGYSKVKEGWDARMTTDQLLSAIRENS